MKALVTGGTGFVGSHVVRALNDEGHRVRVLHRQSSRLDALKGLAYESAFGDVTDADAVLRAAEGMDVIFHVAAVADYWRADRQRMFDVNVEGTRRVLRAAQAQEVQRVVFTSSAAAVGLLEEGPADEGAAFNLSPEQFPYGYSKKLAEDVVAGFVADGLAVVTLNPVVIMGPGDLNVISGTFMVQMKRFGAFTPATHGGVSVIDVRDVARYHLAAAKSGEPGQRYILTTANYTYREWFGMIAEIVGVRPPLFYTPNWLLPPLARLVDAARALGIPTPIDANQVRLGSRYVYFNGAKAWQAFGPPHITMRQSLEDTYAWYRAHGLMR